METAATNDTADVLPPVDDRPGRRAPTWVHVVVAALAFAFLGGAAGYLLGEGRAPSEGSVDVGFLRDMIDHHEQAVLMSRLVLAKDDVDPVTRSFAEEVLIFQMREIGIMDTFLDQWGRARGDLERRAMTWMDMGVPVADMAGMQSPEALDALESASGADADQRFLTMMREHHRGGVHMAEHAAQHASTESVRELADRMARFQSAEIDEYTGVLVRMGFE
jgi:uncharacterized protein (DUF305 family)